MTILNIFCSFLGTAGFVQINLSSSQSAARRNWKLSSVFASLELSTELRGWIKSHQEMLEDFTGLIHWTGTRGNCQNGAPSVLKL